MRTYFENTTTIYEITKDGHFWIVTYNNGERVFRDYESAKQFAETL